jgi:class 3 adenylate cyclase
MDPEDARSVLRTYQDLCSKEINHYSGHVAQYLGDGVLAYFGYPQAQENSPERAVRSALGIVGEIGRSPPVNGQRLKVRVGIATGLVVIGQSELTFSRTEVSVTGETPNIAARLQAIADPGTVLISDQTHALTRGIFQSADLGSVSLKGIPTPIRVWRVDGEIVGTRFAAAHPLGVEPMIGREEEVALLCRRFELCMSGHGQAVLLCGEAGIGKSRIAEQVQHRLKTVVHSRIVYQCSPYHTDSALQPALAQLELAAGLTTADLPDVQRGKLEALLTTNAIGLESTFPFLCALLNIPAPEGYIDHMELNADVLRRRTLEALANFVVSLSRQRPVFWLVEDAHWIDPTTRDLIKTCLERIRTQRVFLLITTILDAITQWAGLPEISTLSVTRLSGSQCTELIEQLRGDLLLPANVVNKLVARSDGIPLFVEELTKAVVEASVPSAKKNSRL